MYLSELIKDFSDLAVSKVEINDLCLNTKTISKNSAFFAISGYKDDGRNYLVDAVLKGAKALIIEAENLNNFAQQINKVYELAPMCPIIPIANLSSKLGLIAAKFYAIDHSTIELVGITGTNGKTTCSYILAQALSKLGVKTGLIGTLGWGFIENIQTANLTTPDAISLHKMVKTLQENGAKVIVLEVSSHSLEQNRVAGLEFTSAIFTNLTQDHLDYHKTMQNYAKAKQKLFFLPGIKRWILNLDEEFTKNFLASVKIKNLRENIVKYFYTKDLAKLSKYNNFNILAADDIELKTNGIKFDCITKTQTEKLNANLIGEFNVGNLLAVVAELLAREFKLKDILHAIRYLEPAPGRMQRLGGGANWPQIIIDYAHTNDALEKSLIASREYCKRKLWCIFGCGGDRDKQKRSLMGNVAMQLADEIIITNDNPRHEDPQSIINDIIKDFNEEQQTKLKIIENRKDAIIFAINHALALDTILIAGKGNENYQIIKDQKLSHSDILIVENYLQNKLN